MVQRPLRKIFLGCKMGKRLRETLKRFAKCGADIQWSSIQPEKRSEALTQATAWMSPDDRVLSERSPTKKDTYCMIPLL